MNGGEPPPSLGLGEIASLAEEAGFPEIAREAFSFAQRVAEGRFFVTVVGQFKRGKSSLLNALIEDRLLPTGVVPITTAPTIIRHGLRRAARVRLSSGASPEVPVEELASWVSEAENPGNEKGVALVEVFSPNPLLSQGMCLVDTPGIGSVLTHNTDTTKTFVRHIDAAIVVLGADPPISGEELVLVEEIARDVREIVYVLNKADRLSEPDLDEACAFTARVLAEKLGCPIPQILRVSVAERLAGSAMTRDWPMLTRVFERLSRQSGADLVAAAESRGVRVLGERLRRAVDQATEALRRPLEATEARLAELGRCVEAAEHSLGDLSYLLRGERERLAKTFSERRERFLERALQAASFELSQEIDSLREGRASFRRTAIDRAQRIGRLWLDRWRTEEEPIAEEAFRNTSRRFIELADEFLEHLSAAGDRSLGALPQPLCAELRFRTRSDMFFTEMLHLTGRAPWTVLADWLGPTGARRRASAREALRYLRRLLLVNTARVESDFTERVLESQRALETEIRRHLNGVVESADRMLEHARATKAEGEGAILAEIERLQGVRRVVDGASPSPEPPRSR